MELTNEGRSRREIQLSDEEVAYMNRVAEIIGCDVNTTACYLAANYLNQWPSESNKKRQRKKRKKDGT